MEKLYYTANDLATITGYSKGKCYKLIRTINERLKEKDKGVITLSGRVLIKEFNKALSIERDW